MSGKSHLRVIRRRRKRREERIKARILAAKAEGAKSRPTSAT
jgi:hypothetical protein